MKSPRLYLALLIVVIAGMTGIFAFRFAFEPELEPAHNEPRLKPTGHLGTWSLHHAIPPSRVYGAAAVGSPGDSHASFVDVSPRAGIDYKWSISGSRPLNILATIGNGCAFLDYDGDGNLDILLVGKKIGLYHGDGKGHFTDVTRKMGLSAMSGDFRGCAVGDFDNDGFDDIYLSGYRTGILLHNEQGTGFRDVTAQAGLKQQEWGSGCAWGQIGLEGRLSLYVANYVKFDPRINRVLCKDDGQLTVCSPDVYRAAHGALYRNNGRGMFTDITRSSRAIGEGKSLGVSFVDYNGSGRQSLAITNDGVPGDLFSNVGSVFQNVGGASGFGYDNRFRQHAGMGVDWGDFNNDGYLDAAVMTFHGEPKSIYRNSGDGAFVDVSDGVALSNYTLPYVAFGVKWLDFDNDGFLDLMISNGHVATNVADVDKAETYRQPTQLFRNDKGRLFVDMSARAGRALQRPIVGRGLATGDFDNDGRVDALVVDSEGAPLLLHNESAPVGHFLTVTLVGTKSNRDGYGAILTAHVGGRVLTQLCHADGSYFSSSDKRVHFGLGDARAVESLTVKWPSGHVDTFHHLAADRFITLREGSGH
jgi:hypothetical protein